MAEFIEGYDFGTIISDNEIELIYLQDGESAETFIEKYHRMKS
jgi:predicted RNA-binding protein with PIN domain